MSSGLRACRMMSQLLIGLHGQLGQSPPRSNGPRTAALRRIGHLLPLRLRR